MKQVAQKLVLPAMDAAGTLFTAQSRRSDLPHLTEIIEHLGVELGEPYPEESEGGFSREDLDAFAEEGFVWETILTAAWKKRLWVRHKTAELDLCLEPQSAVVVDKIIMTPDWFDLKNWRLVEGKATTRSRLKWDQHEKYFWRWLMQVKGYCWALDTLRCDLYVRWTCGSWRPPTPEAWLYELEFTKAELQENWALVKATRDRMMKAKGARA